METKHKPGIISGTEKMLSISMGNNLSVDNISNEKHCTFSDVKQYKSSGNPLTSTVIPKEKSGMRPLEFPINPECEYTLLKSSHSVIVKKSLALACVHEIKKCRYISNENLVSSDFLSPKYYFHGTC
ncbi:hypothetical protein [Erwinia mallotivora]|uniref:hypothetical protein n=1 Tax=Erwinia mallotivora TaxID=69222 RepID=UPI0021BF0123|nr:hypothetical protein [Erwinia mallotivora]